MSLYLSILVYGGIYPMKTHYQPDIFSGILSSPWEFRLVRILYTPYLSPQNKKQTHYPKQNVYGEYKNEDIFQNVFLCYTPLSQLHIRPSKLSFMILGLEFKEHISLQLSASLLHQQGLLEGACKAGGRRRDLLLPVLVSMTKWQRQFVPVPSFTLHSQNQPPHIS